MSRFYSFISKVGHSYQLIVKIMLFLAALCLIIWLMPRNAKFKYDYQKMRPWQHESLYAPFNFPIYKTTEQLKNEQETFLKDVYPIFIFDNKATSENKKLMLKDFDMQWSGDVKDKMLSRQMLEMIYDTIENKGILSHTSMLNGLKPESLIDVVHDKVIRSRPLRDFYTMNTAIEMVSALLSNVDDDVDKILLNKLLLNHLHQNLIYSEDLTNQTREQVLSTIPLTFGMVQKDELIISEGELDRKSVV